MIQWRFSPTLTPSFVHVKLTRVVVHTRSVLIYIFNWKTATAQSVIITLNIFSVDSRLILQGPAPDDLLCLLYALGGPLKYFMHPTSLTAIFALLFLSVWNTPYIKEKNSWLYQSHLLREKNQRNLPIGHQKRIAKFTHTQKKVLREKKAKKLYIWQLLAIPIIL